MSHPAATDNTAKLSSPILLSRTVSYDVGTNPPRRGAPHGTMTDTTGRRRRSSSILQVYHEPPEPIEQLSDQSALPNLNADWVNAKGNAVTPFGTAGTGANASPPPPSYTNKPTDLSQ